MTGKKQVVLTVDVEDFFEPRPPFDTYQGIIGDKAYGSPLVMDLLERHGGRGTFFVDVYNRRTVTEQSIADTVQEIANRGHEVALHTHPAFPIGKRGYAMEQTMKMLNLEDQISFIAKGAALIEKWTGRRPVSHRAGGYGANYETLKALAANGIFVDSSVFYGYPYCGLNDPPLTVNLPVMYNGVLEIPVTVTRSELTLGSLRIFSLNKKLDPDWCSPDELRRQIDALISEHDAPILLFLHSYSLMKIEKNFQPDTQAIENLNSILDYVRRRGAELTTLEQASKDCNPAGADALWPAPLVSSELLWRHREQARWLMKKVRFRHLNVFFDLRRSNRDRERREKDYG